MPFFMGIKENLRVGLLYSGLIAGGFVLKNQIEDKFYSSADVHLDNSGSYEIPTVLSDSRNEDYFAEDFDSPVDSNKYLSSGNSLNLEESLSSDKPLNSNNYLKTDDKLSEMIKRHEGLRNFAYDDSLGVRTIGVGFNLERKCAREKISELGLNFSDVYSGKSEISDAQAYFLMKEDIENSILDAKKYIGESFDNLPLDVLHVLVDMSYNLGYPKLLKFEDFRKEILKNNFDGAAEEMIDSKWYGQVGNRSKELVEIMRNVD